MYSVNCKPPQGGKVWSQWWQPPSEPLAIPLLSICGKLASKPRHGSENQLNSCCQVPFPFATMGCGTRQGSTLLWVPGCAADCCRVSGEPKGNWGHMTMAPCGTHAWPWAHRCLIVPVSSAGLTGPLKEESGNACAWALKIPGGPRGGGWLLPHGSDWATLAPQATPWKKEKWGGSGAHYSPWGMEPGIELFMSMPQKLFLIFWKSLLLFFQLYSGVIDFNFLTSFH